MTYDGVPDWKEKILREYYFRSMAASMRVFFVKFFALAAYDVNDS